MEVNHYSRTTSLVTISDLRSGDRVVDNDGDDMHVIHVEPYRTHGVAAWCLTARMRVRYRTWARAEEEVIIQYQQRMSDRQ